MGKLGETGRTRHLFMLRLACHGCTVIIKGDGVWKTEGGRRREGGGMHDLKVEGTEHTHTTHRTQGGAVRLRGWLTVDADWSGKMASKTAVPSSLALDCRVPGISM